MTPCGVTHVVGQVCPYSAQPEDPLCYWHAQMARGIATALNGSREESIEAARSAMLALREVKAFVPPEARRLLRRRR